MPVIRLLECVNNVNLFRNCVKRTHIKRSIFECLLLPEDAFTCINQDITILKKKTTFKLLCWPNTCIFLLKPF